MEKKIKKVGKENVSSKKPRAKKEKEAEPVVVKFGDMINFMELFRCKGRQGLHTLISQVNKSGMVGIREFLDFGNKATVKASDLICLGQLVIETEAGFDNITLKDVFNNIDEFETGGGDIEIIHMETMAPNYDDSKFKPYHVEQIKKWYQEIKTKINSIEDEKPITEDKK